MGRGIGVSRARRARRSAARRARDQPARGRAPARRPPPGAGAGSRAPAPGPAGPRPPPPRRPARRAIALLRDARGLGRVRVLALARGIRRAAIPGLAGPVPDSRRFSAGDLPLTRLPDPFADLYE